VGKEMIEGGYLTISSEKWMRKFSQKKFKKFDLLLRNKSKVCIIDWKFSRVNADEKIAA
jgi:5-methylcytosine-specific restriction endonuclease McrBC regulatory subunit McrC